MCIIRFRLKSNRLKSLKNGEQVPAVETPEVAEAQAPEVDQHQDLRNKLNRLADYVEIGAWALQSLVILDDIDDAYENKPYLLQDMNISKQDMENTHPGFHSHIA